MPTEISEVRSKIRDKRDKLPLEKLIRALNFLEDLQRSEEEETQALLNEPGLLEDYRQAKEDIRTGKTISWESIKRDV